MKINPLIPLGTKIKVDKSKIKDLLPDKKLDNLPQIIYAEVTDYKMTDGMGIGYVLMTENNLKIWIFKSELNEETKREYKIDVSSTGNNEESKEFLLSIGQIKYNINGNRNFKDIINPINLISWLIYTLKDIF